ncbi:ATP-binding protein [Streptomyces sp. NPDC092359]|uniref:ATP-binding protein n=1 Tax=Streptomyces sp. NPDC092359 TaxID=3366014 RepID=UPI0038242F79
MTTVIPPPEAGAGVGFEAVMPPEHKRVGEARRAALSWLEHWHVPAETDAVALIVSELVTNAVQHGEGPVRLRILYRRGSLWIGVTDESTVPARLREAGDEDLGGRGLYLVDALADRWGTAAQGRTVWATLPLRAGGLRC